MNSAEEFYMRNYTMYGVWNEEPNNGGEED